jgi:hypothetical protein
MGWREDVKLGIGRIGTLFLGDDNGQMGTEITVTPTELNSLDHSGNLVADENGAGMDGQVETYRWNDQGNIITEIQVDIGGCTVTGTAQGSAIGLTTIDGCYVGRYVLATYGNIYKIEMICVETPTEGDSTFEQDVDLCYTTASDIKAGEDVDVDIIAAARDWVVGEMAQNIIPKLTPDGDYLYLATGDTAGDTGTYAAGQFILRFYGHAAL